MSVSRTAYREAVRILAAKGLVASRPKRGTQVLSEELPGICSIPRCLRGSSRASPSQDFLVGLVRAALDHRARSGGARGANAARPDDLARMRDALQRMERHGLATTPTGRAPTASFTTLSWPPRGNPALVALSSSIGAAVRWTTIFKQRKRRLPRDPLPDHWRVFDAIAAGGSDAARAAMQELVSLALEDTQLSMK